jgi:hypothetical protein
MKELKINERFREACPELTRDELQKLEELILKDGVIYTPILTWNDTIIDGHNRYSIARKHKIPFETKEHPFDSEDDAVAWIIENAISQRNLNDYQRSKLALELEKYYKAKSKERMQAGKKTDPVETLPQGKTRDQLGEKAHVSGKTIDKVRFIEQKAKKETKRQLEKGEVTINHVYHELQLEEQWNERHPDYYKIQNQVEVILEGLPKEAKILFRTAVQKINFNYFDKSIPEVDLPKLAKKINKRITEDKLTPNLSEMKNLIYQEYFGLDEYAIKVKGLGSNIEKIETLMDQLSNELGVFNGALHDMKIQKAGLSGFNSLGLTVKMTRLVNCFGCFAEYLGYKPEPTKPNDQPPTEPPRAITKNGLATDVAFEEPDKKTIPVIESEKTDIHTVRLYPELPEGMQWSVMKITKKYKKSVTMTCEVCGRSLTNEAQVLKDENGEDYLQYPDGEKAQLPCCIAGCQIPIGKEAEKTTSPDEPGGTIST